MNQRQSKTQRQAIKSILAKHVSRREARLALLGDLFALDGMRMVVNIDENGRNCNEYLKYDKPITEDAFWKAWDAYSNAVGPGNATITVLDE